MNIEIRYRTGGVDKQSAASENEDYSLAVFKQNERTTIQITAKRPLALMSASFSEPFQYDEDDLLYLNGYQSWTDTREYSFREQLKNMNRLPQRSKDRFHFESYGDAWFYKYKKDCYHSFAYAYIRKRDGHTDFVGSLNEKNAFLIIEYIKQENRLSLRSDCTYKKLDGTFTLFDFVRYEGKAREVLQRYFDHFGACSAPPVRGYTSWYLDYQNISEKKILKTLDSVNSSEFDLFQIDDGYETFVGDWMDIDEKKFPNGLAAIVDRIHAKGMKAGIWLAPFVCEVKSRLFHEHPDWIRRVNGKEMFAGCNWSGDVALDVRNREVQECIRECLKFHMNAGFDFFKLDFLYAAAIIREDEGLTRAEAMRMGMGGLREILQDKLILGCGVPLSSAFNLVDYCRIGPDVSLRFDDVAYMRLAHRERISTKTTLQNSLYRSCMDGTVFRCDPDVYLLRDDHISLSKEQRRALVMINHLCGAVYMTSDDPGRYDAEKTALLREARKLTRARITDVVKSGDRITARYELDGEKCEIVYDRKKGVLVEGK